MRSLYAQFGETYGLKKLSADDEERIRDLHGRELLKALGLPIWKVPRIMRAMRGLMAEEAERFRLFPEIDACLRALFAGGVRLGIVSSNSRENIEKILGADLSKLIHHFDCGASMFGKASKVRRVVRVSGTGRGIYIGDEVRDAEAARDAGLAFGAVAWGHHRLEILCKSQPDEVFHRPGEIAPRILSGNAT